jgi:flavodoxin
MKKVLVVYFSLSGKTEKMAEYIAEGVRFAGLEARAMKTAAIKTAEELAGYDGYIFGSPTYHNNMADPMKTFLFLANKAPLEGKLAGSFGSHAHSGNAPGIILDTMEHVYKMKVFEGGPFMMREPLVDTTPGMRACQDYGRGFADTLAK